MKIFIKKDVLKNQIRDLEKRGGNYQRAAGKIREILSAESLGEDVLTALQNLPLTNHGENRIKHCVKYDLPGYCRLITIQNNGVCAILFAGDHDSCDKWLTRNTGCTISYKNQEIKDLNITYDLDDSKTLPKVPAAPSIGKLLSKLPERYLSVIEDQIRASIYKIIAEFDSLADDEEILAACSQIRLEGVQEMVFDVLLELRSDNLDKAKDRILYYEEEVKAIEKASEDEVRGLSSNDDFLLLDDFNQRDIQKFMNSSSWHDWMLFMHPQQSHVVERDFSGPARLLGVSGSGKTCVAVNRAIRLAKKYPNEKILITTVNVALASLIDALIVEALDIEHNAEEIKAQIEVKSFWNVCRDLILSFEKDPLKRKSLNQYSDKHLEDVDEVWEEFYLMKNNNNDAAVLLPVHNSLLGRNIYPLQYLKQEFDWIRSGITLNQRHTYLQAERKGRAEQLLPAQRKLLLKGLEHWEQKMADVGVCDYLGLIDPLYKYFDKIQPAYRSIIVDELQDFGTTELKILRKLVAENENDLFLCGDIAQQVQTKHHMPTVAGIVVPPLNYLKILKNYRNSKEILTAALNVFQNNTTPENYNSADFELLNPEFANFSSSLPFIRQSSDINDDISNALTYLQENMLTTEKACIAICGLTYFQVTRVGKVLNLPVLDGEKNIFDDSIFLSDLDQTKGFEFDKVIIINCNTDVLPNPRLPKKEHFREVSKLYVAMTRAKKELIISYSSNLSELFSPVLKSFNSTTAWHEYFDSAAKISVDIISAMKNEVKQELSNMSGIEFVYSVYSIGLSVTAQQKLITLVAGKSSTNASGRPDGWRTMGNFLESLGLSRFVPHMSNLLGPSIYKEIKAHLQKNQIQY